jgi:hypothetical protein
MWRRVVWYMGIKFLHISTLLMAVGVDSLIAPVLLSVYTYQCSPRSGSCCTLKM